ncbi:hypothetical protein ONV78_15150 [Hahella sp. CR1]|uniref:hypothetical protein n=1 Tax=Hahella sp. CR1 TaxID=2992807 RepID=UPI0024426B12|nr:hypothetical protein [Hahella sp. CR1]MDG9669080.1 hypothetical protein [Hahella sp. CR1]
MSKSTFWRGAVIALALSIVGALALVLFAPVVGEGFGLRLLISALGLAYVVILLRDSRARTGRLVVFSAWMTVTAALFLLNPGVWVWLTTQTAAIWLTRCLYIHDSLIAAALDAFLNGAALLASLAAALHTHSLFLALWTFFLVQAAFVYIPRKLSASGRVDAPASNEEFERAYRNADAALRRLSRHS